MSGTRATYGELRYAHNCSRVNDKGSNLFGDVEEDGRIILKRVLKEPVG
jgi:hypothetical protein